MTLGSAGVRAAQRVFRARGLQVLLLIAILPSMTFLGHWGLQFDIPGSRFYVVLMPAPQEHEHDPGEESKHEQHCHANAASCTDVPFTGASPFALLQSSVEHLGAMALLIAFSVAVWRPGRSLTIGPELQPPQRMVRA
jgi:hypothetical protein